MTDGSQQEKPGVRRFLEALLVVVFVLGTAHAVAAAAAMRGWPMWLSIAGAVLVFPLLPGLWHLLAERRRRKKAPKKVRTTGKERLLYRVLAVTCTACLGLGLTLGWNALKALRQHSDWMIPEPASARSCASLAEGFRAAVGEDTGSTEGDDDWIEVGRAKLHYQCVAMQWNERDRACVVRALEGVTQSSLPQDAQYIDPCDLGDAVERPYDPASAPDCGAVAEAAEEAVRRRVEREPKLSAESDDKKAAYAAHFRDEVHSSCTARQWGKRERACLDIGFRYTVAPVMCAVRVTRNAELGELEADVVDKLRGSHPL